MIVRMMKAQSGNRVSITVDGVSLTVVEAGADSFTVSLIPETLARTTLGIKQPGDVVNLEVDVIAKHVERLMQKLDGTAQSRLTIEKLRGEGY